MIEKHDHKVIFNFHNIYVINIQKNTRHSFLPEKL